MKILFFIFFIFFLKSPLSSFEFQKVIKYLENGEFDKFENIVKSVKDINSKNYLFSIYYLYLGDYKSAYEYAKTLKSKENDFFLNYIKNMYKIISNGYKEFETEHFIIRLKDRDILLKDLMAERLEKIREVYGKIFNYYPKDKLIVEVFNTKEEFCLASTLSEKQIETTGVVGIYKFNKIMIISPENLLFGYRWVDTLAHEYIHLIINRITKSNLPLYLHEGIARYFDTLYRSSFPVCFTCGNINVLIEAKRNKKLIPFESMKGSFAYFDSKEKAEIAFMQVASFIDYLVTKFGIEKLVNFLNENKKFKNEIPLYKKIFKTKYRKILNDWSSTIDRWTTSYYPGAISDLNIQNAKDEDNLIGLTTQQYIKIADEFLKKGDFKTALYHYEKAKTLEPYNPVIITKSAKTLINIGNFRKAEEILKECININPNYILAYEVLIKLYYQNENYQKILELYPSVLDINPFNSEIRKIVMKSLIRIGDYKNAFKECEMLLILDPEEEIRNIYTYLSRRLN